MPFTILDYGAAADNRQSVLYSTDLAVLVAALGGDGVLGGCVVSAPGGMSVSVAAGAVRIGGVNRAVAGGSGTITTADSTNPRIDVISINTSGAIVVTAGTPGANPVAPAVPASSVALAFVDVPAADASIAANQITDKRALVGGADLYARAATGTTYSYDLPGVSPVNYTETVDMSGNTLYYMPIIVRRPISVDRIACDVTGFNDAGNKIRMGLYRSDLNWQPIGSPLIDQEIDASTTGLKEASITAITVYPGLYLLVAHPNDTIRCRGSYAGNVAGMSPVLGNDRFINALTVARTYAALPDPALAWSTIEDTYSPAFMYSVYLRVAAVS